MEIADEVSALADDSGDDAERTGGGDVESPARRGRLSLDDGGGSERREALTLSNKYDDEFDDHHDDEDEDASTVGCAGENVSSEEFIAAAGQTSSTKTWGRKVPRSPSRQATNRSVVALETATRKSPAPLLPGERPRPSRSPLEALAFE